MTKINEAGREIQKRVFSVSLSYQTSSRSVWQPDNLHTTKPGRLLVPYTFRILAA